jgi:hypothetical protein
VLRGQRQAPLILDDSSNRQERDQKLEFTHTAQASGLLLHRTNPPTPARTIPQGIHTSNSTTAKDNTTPTTSANLPCVSLFPPSFQFNMDMAGWPCSQCHPRYHTCNLQPARWNRRFPHPLPFTSVSTSLFTSTFTSASAPLIDTLQISVPLRGGVLLRHAAPCCLLCDTLPLPPTLHSSATTSSSD